MDRPRQLLARLSRHEAPIASLPLDFLCALLHQSLRAAVPSGGGPAAAPRRHSDVIYMRWSRIGGPRPGANLVRSETVKLFNASGQVAQVPARQGPHGHSFPPRAVIPSCHAGTYERWKNLTYEGWKNAGASGGKRA